LNHPSTFWLHAENQSNEIWQILVFVSSLSTIENLQNHLSFFGDNLSIQEGCLFVLFVERPNHNTLHHTLGTLKSPEAVKLH
jgi:hypothetical protein